MQRVFDPLMKAALAVAIRFKAKSLVYGTGRGPCKSFIESINETSRLHCYCQGKNTLFLKLTAEGLALVWILSPPVENAIPRVRWLK